MAGSDAVVANFKLRPYATRSLTAGETYTLRLTYINERNTSIALSRDFVASASSAWKKLSHAPIAGGDYTGAAVLSPQFQSRMAVYQYANAITWNVMRYDGKWESQEATNPLPRHEGILFELPYPGNANSVFLGFGYLDNEKAPGMRSYLSNLWSVGQYFSLGTGSAQVFHRFGEIRSTVKYFNTSEEVFILKENDLGAMYSMNFLWDEKKVRPLPEKTGSLTTFRVGTTGYVVNQLPGRPPHLFSYDIGRDQWERLADFPGEIRTAATGFSARGKGYFGLGINQNNKGMRDIWEYDPAKNAWKYHSEYPGQGHRLLIALSDNTKAYLGWGYESRAVLGTAAKQQVGCTDFWEFAP